MDMKKIMANLSQVSGLQEDGLMVKKDTKEGRAWRFECPHIGDDLEFQIFPRDHFGSLIVAKKIAKLAKEISTNLADPKFTGNFLVDVVPDARAIIITQPGFWKKFDTPPEEFVKAIELACEKVL